MKTRNVFLLLASLGACLTTSFAQATDLGPASEGFYAEETFFPIYVSKNDTISAAGGAATKAVTTETGWGVDTHTTIGYVWNDLLMGFTYNYYNLSSSSPRTSDYEGHTELTSKQDLGLTFGGFLGHWRLALTYIFDSTKTYTQKYTDVTTGAMATDETYKDASGLGYELGVGYDFMLGAGFGISPTLLYRNVVYSKQSYEVRTGSISKIPYPMSSLQTKAIDSNLNPMLTINYRF